MENKDFYWYGLRISFYGYFILLVVSFISGYFQLGAFVGYIYGFVSLAFMIFTIYSAYKIIKTHKEKLFAQIALVITIAVWIVMYFVTKSL